MHIQRIALIGAGQMGFGFLTRLLATGFKVHVFDVSEAAMDRAVAIGAGRCETMACAVRAAQAVITMLPTARVVEQAYLDDGGIRANLTEGQLCIEMSTIDPELSIRIGGAVAAGGGEFLDAPVSGGTAKAFEGKLAVMVGGSSAALERGLPVLEAIGSSIIHVGPIGSGTAAKLANNLVASAAMLATAEAFHIGTSYGIDAGTLTTILENSSGDTWILRNLHPVPGVRPDAPSSRGYAPGFSTTLAIGMLESIRTAAGAKRIPLTVVPALLQAWQLAADHGYADKDFASVYEFIRPQSRTRAVDPLDEGREC